VNASALLVILPVVALIIYGIFVVARSSREGRGLAGGSGGTLKKTFGEASNR
jgi:hypothetical protein